MYNCNISKSKLAFPLSNTIYLSVIASIVLKLLRLKPEYFFGGHPVDNNLVILTQMSKLNNHVSSIQCFLQHKRKISIEDLLVQLSALASVFQVTQDDHILSAL